MFKKKKIPVPKAEGVLPAADQTPAIFLSKPSPIATTPPVSLVPPVMPPPAFTDYHAFNPYSLRQSTNPFDVEGARDSSTYITDEIPQITTTSAPSQVDSQGETVSIQKPPPQGYSLQPFSYIPISKHRSLEPIPSEPAVQDAHSGYNSSSPGRPPSSRIPPPPPLSLEEFDRRSAPTEIPLSRLSTGSQRSSQRQSISVMKGSHLCLSQEVPELRLISIGLGWEFHKHGGTFDLDASAFLLNDGGKVRDWRDLIFYNNASSPCGSVVHHGDNRTGMGRTKKDHGDKERVSLNLERVPAEITRLIFVVSIHEAEKRKQNFKMVHNAFIRVVNQPVDQEICRYDLEEVGNFSAMLLGEVFKYKGEWKFRAIGEGFEGGLKAVGDHFGIQFIDNPTEIKHKHKHSRLFG